MSFELEKALRESLQRTEPAADFTERLLARIAAEERAASQAVPAVPAQSPVKPVVVELERESWWQRFLNLFQVTPWRMATAGGLACVLLVAVFSVQRYREQQREIAEGERAKEQVMLALQIASSKLNTAQRKVQQVSEREALSDAPARP